MEHVATELSFTTSGSMFTAKPPVKTDGQTAHQWPQIPACPIYAFGIILPDFTSRVYPCRACHDLHESLGTLRSRCSILLTASSWQIDNGGGKASEKNGLCRFFKT